MNNEVKAMWNDLERRFHEPARLALVTALCEAAEGLSFPELKDQCSLTDGNLNRHLKVLQEAGTIRVHKMGKGRRSRTRVVISPEGRRDFVAYLQVLEQVLHGALDAADAASPASGWTPGLTEHTA